MKLLLPSTRDAAPSRSLNSDFQADAPKSVFQLNLHEQSTLYNSLMNKDLLKEFAVLEILSEPYPRTTDNTININQCPYRTSELVGDYADSPPAG